MKTAVIILLFAFSAIESRKVVPINKHANIDFINMETGGQGPAVFPAVAPPAPAKPIASPAQQPTPPKTPTPTAKPVPAPAPVTTPPKPAQPQQPKPNQPNQGLPTQMDLKPVQPAKPAGSAVTTPGPGNVKQLVTFYDSQGKRSVIRPYSYSQAVKQG